MQTWQRKRNGRFVVVTERTDTDSELRRGSGTHFRAQSLRRQTGALALRMLGVSVAVAITSVSLVGMNAWAVFNDTKTGQSTVASGTVTLALGTSGTSANRLSVGVSNMVPGDTMQRAINISNTGTVNWASLAVTTTATASSGLDTDATNGLQMTVDECSVAWTESGPPYSYSCSGTTTSRIASSAVIQAGSSIGGAALTAGSTGYYRIRLSLPVGASNAMQNLSSTIQYSFTGTQRNGTDV